MGNSPHRKVESDHTVDTLKISEQEYQRLLGKLDQVAAQSRGKTVQRRRDRRFTHPAQMIVRMMHPGGTTGNYLVRTRDVSANGLGFLHGNFVHVATRCVIYLAGREGKWYRIEGQVVRCRLIERRTHEVGVLFDEPIDIATVTTVCDDEDMGELEAALQSA